jgi:trimeric autotransporter adhesin
MSTQVQYRRGTATENNSFTGALAEITVDTTNGTLRVHDGATAGGSNIATVAYVTSQISALSANSITNGTSSVSVIASGGNIRSNIAGSTVQTISSGLVAVTGNISGGNLILSGAIEDSGQLDIRTTASNSNIVLTPNGTGNINTSGNIMPVANAAANIGSATLSYNTIFARATSAQYADLAEKYTADADYPPGTVIEFGGTNEVTITTQSHSAQVAGIVSTNPSYLMNSGLVDQNAIDVALVGRVPCQVVGTIAKGDRLVSSTIPGVATTLNMTQYQPGCIVGKALEAYNSDSVGTIEVAVGRI